MECDEADARDAHGDPDTFRPVGVPDRFDRRVRDDHAPNKVLHDVLDVVYQPGDLDVVVNLMASHGPGEKPNGTAPTYEVWVESRNEGMGHPDIPIFVRRLVDRGDAVITDVVECSDDHLRIAIRPVESRVEPIEVDVDDIPDRFVERSRVGAELAGVWDGFADKAESNPDDADVWERAAEVIRRMAIDYDAPAVWEAPEDDRTEDAVEWADEDFASFLEGFKAGDTPMVMSPDPYAGFPFTERGAYPPTGRPPIEPIREWVDERRDDFGTPGPVTDKGADAIAEMIADAIEQYVIRDPDGRVVGESPTDREDDTDDTDIFDPVTEAEANDRAILDAVVDVFQQATIDPLWAERDVEAKRHALVSVASKATDMPAPNVHAALHSVKPEPDHPPGEYRTRIACGCGDYGVDVPEGDTPPSIDVVCPECGNHFGQGPLTGERSVVDVDHIVTELRDLRDRLRSGADARGEDLGAHHRHAVGLVENLIDRYDDPNDEDGRD